MTDAIAHSIHPAARRDLVRALTLLGLAPRRAEKNGTPVLVGAAAEEALHGGPAARCVEALAVSPSVFVAALQLQGWRPVAGAAGLRFEHPATGLHLLLDAPAVARLPTAPPGVFLEIGSGHSLLCWPRAV